MRIKKLIIVLVILIRNVTGKRMTCEGSYVASVVLDEGEEL